MEKSPDAFRTISEVASDLGLAQHVLRFWESKFPQLRPLKRGGGRRFYRPDDVALLRSIQRLLHDSGYTIRGVQRILKQQGPRAVAAMGTGEMPIPPAVPGDEVEDDQSSDSPLADGLDHDGERPPQDAAVAPRLGDRETAHRLVATLLDCAALLTQARITDLPSRLADHLSDAPPRRGSDDAPLSPSGPIIRESEADTPSP